ncbi:MAG: TenA family protein, partial [Alphaproteobacteria bacterium]
FARLRARSAGTWQAHVGHRFVAALADGSLPAAAFRSYLAQDHLYIVQFARAHALAAVKADTVAAMRHALNSAVSLLEVEGGMQDDMAEQLGEKTPDTPGDAPDSGPDSRPDDGGDDSADGWRPRAMHPTTLAYTSFQMERGMSGDLLDLRVAMTPCTVGYAEIGRSVARALGDGRNGAPFDPAGHPYGQWIATYAGEAYQTVTRQHLAELDRLWKSRGGDARFASLSAIFDQAARFEAAFWEMGLE